MRRLFAGMVVTVFALVLPGCTKPAERSDPAPVRLVPTTAPGTTTAAAPAATPAAAPPAPASTPEPTTPAPSDTSAPAPSETRGGLPGVEQQPAPGLWEIRELGKLPPVLDVSWSPDGRRLALLAEYSLEVYEPGRCALQTWAQLSGAKTELLGWEPGTSRVIIRRADGEIQAVGPDGEQGRPFSTPAVTGSESSLSTARPSFIPAHTPYTTSADGRRYVYMDQTGFWTVNRDGTNRQLLMDQVLPGIQEMVWLAQDEIVLTQVTRSAGGGTEFDLLLISRGEPSALDSYTRRTLYPRPDLRQVAYIQGPPVDELPGQLGLYPEPSGCTPAPRPDAEQTWVIDLDRDGRAEQVTLTKDSLVITRGTGQVLYEGMRLAHRVNLQPYTMPDGNLLLHTEWPGACPRAPQNQLLWYDPATGQVTDVHRPGPCGGLFYEADGRFLELIYSYPATYGTPMQWEGRGLAVGESTISLAPLESEDQIPRVLSDIAGTRLSAPEDLFDPPELYQAFAARTSDWSWDFMPVPTAQPGQMQLQATRNGKPQGTLLLDLKATPDGLRITGLTWRDP